MSLLVCSGQHFLFARLIITRIVLCCFLDTTRSLMTRYKMDTNKKKTRKMLKIRKWRATSIINLTKSRASDASVGPPICFFFLLLIVFNSINDCTQSFYNWKGNGQHSKRATTGQQAKGEGVVNSSKQIIKTQTINSSRKCFKFVLSFLGLLLLLSVWPVATFF